MSRLFFIARFLVTLGAFSAILCAPAPSLALDDLCLPPKCTAFPKNAGVLNVRDFGAKGNGITDDTAAINAALAASGGDTGPTFWHDKIVYFPDGKYLVSAPLVKRYAEGRFGSGAIMIGQSKAHTVIRLRDRAEGYQSVDTPRPVIMTTAKLLDGNATSGGKDYTNKGEGNDAFMNFIENMTVDVGAQNPGAIGVDYLANNVGAMRNVIVRAPSGSGAVGISMARKWPGPALLSGVTVEGFDTGIDIRHTEYSITMENIVLSGPHKTGLRNQKNIIAARNLTIENAEKAIENTAPEGLIVISGGSFTATAQAGEAVDNRGYLHLRDVNVKGYATMLGEAAPAQAVSGVYEQNKRLSDAKTSWSLPVKDAPDVPMDAPSKWVSITDFGAIPDSKEDATKAIRRAFKSGASTIYFPHGTYYISENIAIPGTVRRIAGMFSTIAPHAQAPYKMYREKGIFRANNNAFPLIIERLAIDNTGKGLRIGVEALGTQPVVLRDMVGAGVTMLYRPAKAGEAFLENMCCGLVQVQGKQPVFARQLNTEGGNTRIRNNGSPLWILGLKTERECTVLENQGGAVTEILGGLIYMVVPAKNNLPAFKNVDSRLSLSLAEEAFKPQNAYQRHVLEVKGGVENATEADSFIKRGEGRMIPFYTSGQ